MRGGASPDNAKMALGFGFWAVGLVPCRGPARLSKA